MGRAEYVVQFKGDYSALQKDINKINGETRKLANDEVIIKLNYDGNIKEFNKVFDEISKLHPELGIQFQYNVNQKILEQELGKLDQLTELKLDVDNGRVQEKLEKMADGIESALQNKLSKDEITKQLTEYFGYYNTAIKAGAKRIDIDSINNRLVESFEIEEDEIKKIFDNVFDLNASKPYQLFKLDTSINEEINITKDRVQDLKDTIKSLEERGASKTGLPSDLQKVQDEIKILRSDIQDMQEQLKDLSGEAFTRMSENIKETNRQLDITKERLKVVQDFLKNNGNSEVLNFTEALNKLQGMLSTFYKENNGNHVSSFWDELIQKAQDGDEEVLQLLSDLRLLKDDNLPNKVNAGMVKSGGLVGDDYTVLTTKIHSDKFSGDRLKDAEELKKRLDAISDSGVNAAKTLAIVSDEASNLFVEIQETAPGKMLGQIYGQTDKDWVNTDFFEAMDAEILKLIVDLETLRKAGIGVELNAGNLLYKKGKGFTIIDMDLEPLKDYEETISEAQNVLFDSIRQFYELQTDESGNITAEAQTAITALDNFSQKFGDIAEKKKAVIDQLSTAGASNQQITINDAAKEATQKAADAVQQAQDSNSPAELTKPLGKDFGAGYAEGIKEAIPEIVDACKQIVLAAYNALKESKTSEDGESVDFTEGFVNSFKESLDKAVPTIQEKIKEVFSKINIGDENSSMFEGIGQEIIDSIIVGLKNAHSGESFTETLENIINGAFSNVLLNAAVQGLINTLVNEIQTSLDNITSITPFRIANFNVNGDEIVFQIQTALENHEFKLNLSGVIQDLSTTLNTSADNVRLTFLDAIKWMQEANEFQRKNTDLTHERGLWFNSKTGEFSNPAVVGDERKVGRGLTNEILQDAKIRGVKYDTDLHWHRDHDSVAPSDKGGDLDYFFRNVFNEGINKFMVAAQKEIAVFDFSKIASNFSELESILEQWVNDNLADIEQMIGKKGTWISYTSYFNEYFNKIYNEILNDIYPLVIENSYELVNSLNQLFKFGSNDLTDLYTGERQSLKELFPKLSKSIENSLGDSDIFTDFGEEVFDHFYDEITNKMSLGYEAQSISIEDIIKNKIHDSLSDLYFNNLSQFEQEIIDSFTDYIKSQLLITSKNDRKVDMAGSIAMKQLISDNDMIGKFVKYYSYDEFEREFGKGIIQPSQKQSNNSLPSPTIPEDFQAQLQHTIEESGKYIVKVYGELVEEFKSRLQNAIDESGIYHVDIEGWLADGFHDGLQRDIDGQEKYIIEVKGRLIEAFKDILQEAIDGLGAFPIEVKPYMRKGSEIEEVDLSGGNQNNLLSESTDTVNNAIDTEKKKFDELKNKISKTIPNAIETKNKAFEKEGNLVAKIVDDEITYFEVLKDSVDNVTDSIGKQQNNVKDLKPKSKSKNPKKSEDTTNKIDKEALLKQHNTELFRNYAQSIGQKSQIQQDMSAYYAQLEKDSAKAYSDAERKANSLLDKVKKLQSSNKYTQDFKNDLNTAETELRTFLGDLTSGTISFDQLDGKVKELSDNIEGTLARKAFGSVKQAAEKSLTNVGLKIDQIIAKNSAMGKDFETRFKALRKELGDAQSVEAVQKIIAEVNKLESELIATGNTGKSFIDQIKQRLRDINSKYIAQYFSFQDIIRYARQAATNVIQLNDAFIELSKVSNTSLETLEKDFQSYADIAHDIGGTITDTINATADWARMGMINAPLYGNI